MKPQKDAASSRTPLKCLSPAYDAFLVPVRRAVEELLDAYVDGGYNLPPLLSRYDLATRVYYQPASRFPYEREPYSTKLSDLKDPLKRAALAEVMAENLTFLLVREAAPQDLASNLCLLNHLSGTILATILERNYLNTLNINQAKSQIILSLSQTHNAELWRELEQVINQTFR
ncbi:MAG: hypothetical protein SFV17_03485 [Candidatus Obscuribacter sp.]|nr:hypothetical protein [Candidatus Obscuribacter sp.]